MKKKERFFRVKKRYFIDNNTCHIVITNAIRKSANTMTETEINGMKQAWINEGCRIINKSNKEM